MAQSTVETKPITEDDLLRMGAADRWVEAVEGKLVEMKAVGVLHVMVAGNVLRILERYVMEHKLGYSSWTA